VFDDWVERGALLGSIGTLSASPFIFFPQVDKVVEGSCCVIPVRAGLPEVPVTTQVIRAQGVHHDPEHVHKPSLEPQGHGASDQAPPASWSYLSCLPRDGAGGLKALRWPQGSSPSKHLPRCLLRWEYTTSSASGQGRTNRRLSFSLTELEKRDIFCGNIHESLQDLTHI